jgi:flagellar basal body rod protein FlgF
MHPDDSQFDEDMLRHVSVEDFEAASKSHERYMQGHKDFEDGKMKTANERLDAGISGEGY